MAGEPHHAFLADPAGNLIELFQPAKAGRTDTGDALIGDPTRSGVGLPVSVGPGP